MTLPIVRPQFPRLIEFSGEFDECLVQGRVTNNGKWVQEFESALTDYLGCPTIVLNNGHTALMAMLSASNVRGGEVLVSSFTFISTIAAIEWAGAIPVFCDIDPDTLCIDWRDAHDRKSWSAVASVAVAPYGIAPDLTQTFLPCLIDAAPAFGSFKNGKVYAGYGAAMMFSFHATKPFGACMEGGAICSHNSELIERCKRIRNFGQDGSDVVELGLNGKMMEVSALAGLKGLEAWPDAANKRKVAAYQLREALSDIEGLAVVPVPEGQSPIWTYLPIRIAEKQFGMSRDDVVEGLAKVGIQVRKYYTACHQLSRYKHLDIKLPVTERVASQIISLPVYNDMLPGEIEQIADAIKALHKRVPQQRREYVGPMMSA